MAAVATYGSFVHSDDEVTLANVAYQTRYSPRNRKLTERRTVMLNGYLLGSSSSALITAAANVISAYSQDYKDFTFSVGGVQTVALRNSADCLSGVKVIAKSFPRGDADELATVRTFSVTLQGTYDVCEDDLVSWQESIEVTGTGGPLWVVVQGVAGVQTLGGPFAVQLAPATAQFYHQYGQAIGFNSYPVPTPPINSVWEFGYRRRITNTSGTQQGTGIRFYRTTWSYYMATDPRIGTFTNTPTSK